MGFMGDGSRGSFRERYEVPSRYCWASFFGARSSHASTISSSSSGTLDLVEPDQDRREVIEVRNGGEEVRIVGDHGLPHTESAIRTPRRAPSGAGFTRVPRARYPVALIQGTFPDESLVLDPPVRVAPRHAPRSSPAVTAQSGARRRSWPLPNTNTGAAGFTSLVHDAASSPDVRDRHCRRQPRHRPRSSP